ncbi:MAG: hypothetical protein KIT08_05280 [Anaerolineales bacterium]|nr:MAG: hypothetical protein KIT08_05280 [Anaerolineales bacterium]
MQHTVDNMERAKLIDQLQNSAEASIRWKVRVNVLGEDRNSPAIRKLEKEIAGSPRVAALLGRVDDQGRLQANVYAKWQGAQWVLMTLADIGYPRGAKWLQPTADEVMSTWLAERFFREFTADSKQDAIKKQRTAIPLMQGRHRTCASQQGNALYVVLALGLEDERIHQLAERLLYWQWPDGGWNCDKDPDADTSTFIHTLWAMRGLHLYAQRTGDKKAKQAVARATEVFLTRRLYKRARDGAVIREEFTKLHYPLYWHYDILGALKVFAEIGVTKDARLQDALMLLKSKELLAGGWPAESKYYTKVSNQIGLGTDYVGWGGTSTKKMNEWVTADALYVLKRFGELKV